MTVVRHFFFLSVFDYLARLNKKKALCGVRENADCSRINKKVSPQNTMEAHGTLSQRGEETIVIRWRHGEEENITTGLGRFEMKLFATLGVGWMLIRRLFSFIFFTNFQFYLFFFMFLF